MIGVDPHKRSHTSVAIDVREQDSARIHVPGQRRQVRSCDAGRRRGCECWARPVEQERPNDSRSVAVAAVRAPDLAAVQPADHVAVLRLLAKRNLDLGRERNQIACLLHAMICELVTPSLPGAAPETATERRLRARRSHCPSRHNDVGGTAVATPGTGDPRRAVRRPSAPSFGDLVPRSLSDRSHRGWRPHPSTSVPPRAPERSFGARWNRLELRGGRL